MKILFVIERLDFADHIAVAYLSAIAKQLKHSTFFCCLQDSDLSTTVENVKPDIVAYSANIMGFTKLVQAHKKARMVHHFISILGGPQATFSPETFSESGMDAFCVGEGEYAFRDFLINIESGHGFDEIENLITAKKNNPVRKLICDLNELPFPDRDLIIANSFLKDTGKKTFYATRGCPYACTYCCNNYYHELYRGKGVIVRRFSVSRLIREIEDVKNKYRMDFVKFGDDLFAMRADDWLTEFAEEYPKRVGTPFNCYLRFDTVDDALLSLLKKAGCFSVHLSVDSVSRHVRENILNRRMKEVDIARSLRKIREHGINTWVNYMLAVPESALQDDLDTITLSREGKVTYPSYSTTVPMKQTKLYDYCVEKKIIDPGSHVGDMSGCSEKSSLSCFTEKEKNIRYNIYLLGAVIAKLPGPVYKIALALIMVIPPNRLFRKIRDYVYQYHISHTIFRIPKGA
jgi:anaerobic magnesium-protoporphyrin IX monomethyl ester cyclase